jgi:flagellar protein FliO/FliZ
MESVDKEILWAYFKIAISLPLVLLLAYISIRYLGRKSFSYAGRRRMRVREQLWLNPKTAIHLIEVGSNIFLIGQQEGSLFLLKELDELPALLEEEKNVLQEKLNTFSAKSLLNLSSKFKWPALSSFLSWNPQKKHGRNNRE